MSLIDLVIGKQLSAEDQVKRWKTLLKNQERELEKSVRRIESEEVKTKSLLKHAAKRNDLKSCVVLARGILSSRKAKERIHTSKAQLNSLGMSMQQQLAIVKVGGALQKSTQVMTIMNKLCSLPALSQAMQSMSMEMMKAGMIDEIIADGLDGLDVCDEGEIEEEEEKEIDAIITQLTSGLLGKGISSILSTTMAPALSRVDKVDKNDNDDEIESRLKALQSI